MSAAPALPPAARLAVWLNAALAGVAGPDDLLAALPDEALWLDGELVEAGHALGSLRRLGALGCTVALPRPGDPVGLAGPPDFNAAALEAGQAFVVTGPNLGFVPIGESWWPWQVTRPRPLDPAEEAGRLRVAIAEAARRLTALDVAGWDPSLLDDLHGLEEATIDLPPTIPPRLRHAVAQASWVGAVVDAAMTTDGGALSVHDADRRREALVGLERQARHTIVAIASIS